MLAKCPNCATIFRIDADQVSTKGQMVRCSICYHIWKVSPHAVPGDDLLMTGSWARNIWKPFFGVVLVAGLIVSGIFNRVLITAYLPFLTNGFDAIGLTIRPDVSKLQVVKLNASYAGDMMRLSGGLRNNGMLRNHAADLRVTVRDADGAIMREMLVRPNDAIIDAKADSDFFVQLAIGAGTQAHVTVTPLANRIYQ